MKQTIRLTLSLCLFLLSTTTADGRIYINEFMQSNIDCLVDDTKNFPDSWIELYNDTDSLVSMQGYSIGLTSDPSTAYPLPKRNITPYGHFLVFCDKWNRGIHSDFRLESGNNGEIHLFYNGVEIDSVVGIKKQPSPNISYGRIHDAADEWGYQIVPSPGESNEAGISSHFLPDPVFSHKGGVITSPVLLSMEIPDDAPRNTEVRYTLDGTEPNSGSLLYTQPIPIDTTSVVRAILTAPGCISPRSVTHSYIFHPREFTIPIISIVTNGDYFYDTDFGIFAETVRPNGLTNYQHGWRRPINIEIFDRPDSIAVLNQLCETRVKGQSTRSYKMKSLAIYAHKRFGVKRFEHEFFPTQKPGITDYKSLELRNAGNDSHRTYMRDAAIQRIMGQNSDLDWQAWQPTVVYINGEYHGMLNIRERSNEDNIASNYDGLEDIDMVENWRGLKCGDIESFERFKQFYDEDGHSFEEYTEWMDVDEFINHTIMTLYFNNVDYPNNNIIMWRPRHDGGKWRWLAKDLDLGMGLLSELYAEYPTFHWLYNPEDYPALNWAVKPEATRLLFTLLEIPEFRERFIERFSIYMGDFLNSDYIVGLLEEMKDNIISEIEVHHQKNGEPWTNFAWEFERLCNWNIDRSNFMYNHLADFFNLNSPIPLSIECNEHDIDLSINGIQLKTGRFKGIYFKDKSITIKGSFPDPEVTLEGWRILATKDDILNETIIGGATVEISIPDADSISILPLYTDAYIDSISDEPVKSAIDFNKNMDIYDLTGKFLGNMNAKELSTGIYIARQGNIVLKIKI